MTPTSILPADQLVNNADIYRAVSANIRAARTALGMTQTQFAQALQTKRPTIGAYEEGRCEPSLAFLLKLREVTGQTLDQLLGNQPPAPAAEPDALEVRLRVKAEAYEYRIYDLEIAYMLAGADTPESKALWESCERVKANYHRDYPDRPLNPKRNPAHQPVPPAMGSWPPAAKQRKPYTRKAKAA